MKLEQLKLLILTVIVALEEKIGALDGEVKTIKENTKNIDQILEKIKGKDGADGKMPEYGIDWYLTEEDIDKISADLKPIEGVDYFIPQDGKDAEITDELIIKICDMVLSQVKDGKDGIDGVDGSPDTPIEIVEKLNTLENKLDWKVLKDFNSLVNQDTLKRAIQTLENQTRYLIQKTSAPTAPTGITSINADATQAQVLAVGTSGTDFAIVDNGTGTHTFNLPTASATVRGALSSADWTTFNNKGNGTVTSVNASGGTTGLSFSGGPITTSGTLTLAGTLALANGGTGNTTGLPINNLIAATTTNTINNANYAQEWQWNTLGGDSGLKLSSTSTAAASNSQKVFEVNLSGANANASQTTYGSYVTNTHTGTTSTNIGGYFAASGGTTNYGIQVGGSGVLATIGTQTGGNAAGILSFTEGATNGANGYVGANYYNTVPTTFISSNTYLTSSATWSTRLNTSREVGSYTIQGGIHSWYSGVSAINSTIASMTLWTTGGLSLGQSYAYNNNPGANNMLIQGKLSVGTTTQTSTFELASSATTTNAQTITANSLTSGTGLSIASSSITNGSLINVVSTSSAITTNTGLLNVSYSGTPSTSSQTTVAINGSNSAVGNTSQVRIGVRGSASGGTLFAGGGTGYGGYFTATVGGNYNYGVYGAATGASATNIAGYFTASGGTTNYGLVVAAGNVGIGTTTPTSGFQTNSSVAGFYRAITALRTLDATDDLINCTANTFAVTLPTAVGITGRQYRIKNSGTGIITLSTTSSQTIDGNASGVLTLVQWDSIVVVSDGANWIRI